MSRTASLNRLHVSKRIVGLVTAGVVFLAASESPAFFKIFIPPAGSPGDYDHNTFVEDADYLVWKADFGSTENLAADGNGNGVIDAGDYTVWRDHLGESAALAGNWEDPNLWYYNPGDGTSVNGSVPGQFDSAVIHANRTANLSSDAGFVAEMRIGDTFEPAGGTLNINAGGKVTCLGEVLMGASNPGEYKEGALNLNGGTLISYGAFFLAYEPGAHHVVNVSEGSLLDVNQNMFARFGTATVNQTGGLVDVQNNLIWGEGGDDDGVGQLFETRAEYNLAGGELKVGEILSIGRSPGQDRPDSDGRVNVSGGILTAADLIFGDYPEEEAILSISDSGIVRIASANYSEDDANLDISYGFIIGSQLMVSTMNVGGTDYTQIISAAGAAALATAVPEPTSLVMCLVLVVGCGAPRRSRRARAN